MTVPYHTIDAARLDQEPRAQRLGCAPLNDETCRRLAAINRRFYAQLAEAFSASREHPWPGWSRVLDRLVARRSAHGDAPPLRVLDVGCGNGRFAGALRARLGDDVAYLGLDASEALLALARERLGETGTATDPELRRHEIGDDASLADLPAGPFELVAVFGLLHHLPAAARRRALVGALVERLAPGGLLALTAWRFGATPRFRRHVVPWQDWNEHTAEPIDVAQLEEGDHLLSFGASPADRVADRPPRYCHHADDAEVDHWLEGWPVACVDRFDADGRSGDLNHYRVLERVG